MERWIPIPEFPGYSVSDHGRVRNDISGRIMAMLRNQAKVIHVGLWKNGRQYKRSLAKLVANAFLPKNTLDHFTTPIHLDGDPENNHYLNLAWRPRQFADAYHRQYNHWPLVGRPIRDVETGERFHDSWEACMKYGLLDRDVARSVIHGVKVMPTFQQFELSE
jgi:hypothetical protein